MSDYSGTNLKGYELRERIGTGGMGAVYKAFQSTIGREVAIKIILPGYANQPDFIRRFETEAQIIARLEHPYIVPLHDYWRDPEGAYLVMRYLRGGSLKDALTRSKYDLEAAADLLDQTAAALNVAHRGSVIHRDIKPANILLDDDGNAYLTDFGIAKDLAETDGNLTHPDGLIGSPDYLSPEQARTEQVSPQTDIYSLGVVLYEMLCGEHPFPEASTVERLFKHINEPLPFVQSLDSAIVNAVNDVIQKATAKNPKHRFESVVEMAQAFREAAGLGISRIEHGLVEMLTPREQEVLQLLIDGKSNREIGAKLTVELSTVKWYVNEIFHKLNVRSRVQAIVKARELNLIVNGRVSAEANSALTLLPEPVNPYKGLRAFQAADHQDFFGRDRMVGKLIKRLAEKHKLNRFLAIVGPSGSGKSSLVKAGLIPALWRGELPGSDRWFVAEMTPGARPLDELEVALTRISADQGLNLSEQLARDEFGLQRASQMILPDDGSELLLVIDQFEELFTLVEDEAVRVQFLDLIRAVVAEPKSRVRVLVTLRADFYDRPLQYIQLGEMMRERMETVLPLGAEELEQAISRPAERIGVAFEEGLVATIMEDVHYQPGVLPLMQYALTELFECRDGRVLTHDGYHKIGRSVGALATRAEEIYREFGDAGREAARQMFLRMVTLGEGVEDTRRRVPRSELVAVTTDPDSMDDVIDTYAGYRLLALDHDPATRKPTVEVAHEALLREWARLREWLNESRADIRLQRLLGAAALEWRDGGKDASFLLRGSRLAQFETWIASTSLAMTPLERDYLKTSLTQRGEDEAAESARQVREVKLEQRSRTVLRALVGVFAVAAVISGALAIWANEQRQEALRQASMGLAAQARLEQVEGLPERGVLLALEALENYPYTWQAERALFGAVTENRLNRILDGHTNEIESAEWSPDGTLMLTTSWDGTAQIWDTSTGAALHKLEGHTDEVLTGSWSPDGKRVATSSRDGTVRIWDAASGEQLLSLTTDFGYRVRHVPWSPDGKRLVTASGSGGAIMWDTTTGEKLLSLKGHTDNVFDTTFSPNGKWVVTASIDGTLIVWDASTGESILTASHDLWINYADWSPDSSRLATASDDGTVKVWDTETGELLFTLMGEGRGNMTSAIWSPDGDRLLTTEDGRNEVDGVAAIWDMTTGEQLHRLPGGGDLRMGDWSPHSKWVAVHDEFSSTRIWDAETGAEAFTVRYDAVNHSVAWSPDGTQLAVSTGSKVLLWKMGSLPLVEISGQYTELAAWSPDGQHIAGAARGGPLTITDSETGAAVLTLPIVEASDYIGAGWSRDGSLIATTQEDGNIRIWDARSGEQRLVFQAEADQPYLMFPSWSPDGTRLAVEDRSNFKGYVFDTKTGKQVLLLDPNESAWMTPVLWSPDGTRLATGTGQGAVFIWDAASGDEVLKAPVSDTAMTHADWSPDGDRLLVTGFGPASILDSRTGDILQTYVGGEGGSWSPDGRRVVTGGLGVHIWDPSTGTEYAELPPFDWIALWSPDGTHVLTLGSDGVMKVWRVFPDTASLIEYAKDCCVLRDLTPEERVQFGLPPAPGQLSTDTPQASGDAALPALSLTFGLAAVGLIVARRRPIR